MQMITDQICIGGLATKAVLEHYKIRRAISLTRAPSDCEVESHPISDDANNDPKEIVSIIKRIDAIVKAGDTPLYIGCLMGASRSVVIASLYLYYSRQFKSFDDALYYVIQRTPEAMPNPDLVDFVRTKVIPLLKKRG